jgi:hypothetical protein
MWYLVGGFIAMAMLMVLLKALNFKIQNNDDFTQFVVFAIIAGISSWVGVIVLGTAFILLLFRKQIEEYFNGDEIDK